MQVECIIPSTPRVATPSPTPSSSASSASKPGSFASILEQEQAAKAEPEQPVKAVAEEAAETEEEDTATETTDAATETGEAEKAVATLLGAQAAAATTVPVEAQTLVVDGEATAPAVPAATPVTDVTAQTAESAPETPATGFAVPSQPAITDATETAPAPQTTANAAPTEAPVEAVDTPAVTTAATEAPETATATAPKAVLPAAQPAAPATPANGSTKESQTAAQPATPATPATPAKPATAQPEATPVEAAQKPQQASTKPATETVTVEGETAATETFAAATDKPQDKKEVTAKPAKDNATAVKGAQPTENANTANAVTATTQTADGALRDALAAQAGQTEVKPATAVKTAEKTEAAPVEGRQTATTPTLAVGTEPARLVDGAQAAAQQPANASVPVQEPGAVALKSIRFMTLNGEKNLTVKLSPESLGEMVIAITTKDGKLDVQLSATQSGTRDILEKQLGTLRDSLSREGIVVNRVSITADLSGQQQFQQANNRQAGAESNAPRHWAPSPNSPYRTTLSGPAAGPRVARHVGSLDLYA